jgi:hypothetical protein
MSPVLKGLVLETSSIGDLQGEPGLDSKRMVGPRRRVFNPDIIRWDRTHRPKTVAVEPLSKGDELLTIMHEMTYSSTREF